MIGDDPWAGAVHGGHVEEALSAVAGPWQTNPVAALPLSRAARLAFDGLEFFKAGRVDDAEAAYREAAALAPGDPGLRLPLGWFLWWQERLEEALAVLTDLVRDHPDHWAAHHVAAQAAWELGRPAEAEASVRLAILHGPDRAKSHFVLGELLLARGDYPGGFAEREWRFRDERYRADRRWPREPRWQGEPLDGKRLLVLEEAGLGDRLLFARYYPHLVAAGARVMARTTPFLGQLWVDSFDLADVISDREPLPTPDAWVPLESLPHLLGTTVETVPPAPYLRAHRPEVRSWRRHLRLRSDAVNVGLIWGATPGPAAPGPRAPGARGVPHAERRSVPLAELAPLVRVPGVRWFALQKGVHARDRAPEGMRLERLGPDLEDFADTAAAMAAMDLVVTADTSTANLAGGLGLPAWVFLPTPAEWRWGVGERSPWYPSLRLFRQDQPGDWAPVVARVVDELTRLVARRGAA